MSAADIAVIALGAALIVWELWFFLAAPRPAPGTAVSQRRVQEIRVVVKGGYEPSTIFVEAGRPVRLLFYRDETAAASDRVLLPDFGIDRSLPAFETTAVEFTPPQPGDYRFEAGQSGIRGRVVAHPGGDAARANLGAGHATHG